MKRRSFVSSSLGLTAGLGMTFPINGYEQNKVKTSTSAYAPDQPVDLILRLENKFLLVKIYSNASAEIIDRTNNEKWESWPVALQDKSAVEEGHVWLNTSRSLVQQYPGRFIGEVLHDHLIKFTLLGHQNLIIGQFVCEIKLDKDWLVYRILEIDDSIPSLVFPTPLKSDAIILPKGVGEIIRDTERSNIYPRHIYPFFTRLTMRWMGGLKNNCAWLGVFDEGFEDAFGFVANRTAAPLWTRSLSEWRHGFTYRMKFIRGNYVALAKTYRRWVIDNGAFVSLEEKMEKNPQLDSFLGGRAFWISLAFPRVKEKTADDLLMTEEQKLQRGPDKVNVLFTYRELSHMIDRLKKLGLKKGFIKIAGWINGGYDNSHQDIWPPEPALGDISELKSLLAMKGSIVSGLHDNNQDMYAHTPSFPKGVNHNADGTLLTGGVWAGGQAYILNSEASIQYARRNWKQLSSLEPKAMFVDIITAMQLYQSYEEGNLKTKADDLKAKIDLMRFYKSQGILFGSEEVADFGIPYVDWFENRHRRTQGLSVPIWPLTFHDAAFCTRYGGVSRNDGYPGWLEDMLYGYLPHFSIRPDWNQEKLFASLGHVDAWHERIGMAEMINHEFLDESLTLEQTEFSNGVAIVCNFGTEPAMAHGHAVEPGNYRILS